MQHPQRTFGVYSVQKCLELLQRESEAQGEENLGQFLSAYHAVTVPVKDGKRVQVCWKGENNELKSGGPYYTVLLQNRTNVTYVCRRQWAKFVLLDGVTLTL